METGFEMTDASQVVVAGTGPAGLIAALAIARQGTAVTLVGPATPPIDRRTTALMTPSLSLLERLGVLDDIAGGAAELRVMRIVDATRRLVRAPTVTFNAGEIDEARFGLNIPNAHLLRVFGEAVAAEPRILRRDALLAELVAEQDRVVVTLDNGSEVTAGLVIAADGRNSRARDAAGIDTRREELPQSALVANIAHRNSHGSVSTEFHTETGPFTQVPLPGNRSSIVWVVTPAMADELMALDETALALRIEQRMDSMLGAVTVEPSSRQVFRLSTLSPSAYAASRVALIGEAAHVFPPIGAQGLNLGIRDIEEIAGIVAAHAADPGAPEALAAYNRRRRPDVTARSTAVNLLNRSLLSELLPAQIARHAGLSLLGAIPPLRGFFMREGLRPGSGFAALAETMRSAGAFRGRDRAAGNRS